MTTVKMSRVGLGHPDAERPSACTSSRAGPRQLSLGPTPGSRLLKRAGNLLTAAGKPSTPAIHDVLASPPRSGLGLGSGSGLVEFNGLGRGVTSGSEGNGTSNSNLNLGASLRRTFSEVRNSGLALKRSLSTNRRDKGRLGHTRSLSESVGSSHNPPTDQARRSATFATPSLSSEISETSSLDHRTTRMDTDCIHADVKVPLLLQEGTPLTKISAKKKKTVIFRIDPDQGYILWESKKSGIIAIENIKEIRSGADARYYREQFQLSYEYEAKWLTLIYIADGRYKTLHVVAATLDVFGLWDRTLRALHAVRQELMSGLGHVETRQNVWERRYWRGADEQRDDKLAFEEVEKMCRRLNLNYSKVDLRSRFNEADTQMRGYLDFNDFRRFVRLLKDRPELTRLYKKVKAGGRFDFIAFESFMRVTQKSTLSKEELEAIFRKYASVRSAEKEPSQIELPPSPPPSDPTSISNVSPVQQEPPSSVPASEECLHVETSNLPLLSVAPRQETTPTTSTEVKQEAKQCDLFELTMTQEAFINYLLSTDNSAFSDQNAQISQDMTRPLPEYYISSSHNTYLVGHQLVGVSTIEGYIRALLHSCRSVEIDIYDGENEPVIYHGKTFTSKVPLRDICQAIAKYAFIASPYPVIISAEVHCSLVQQDLVASIMRTVFGDALVSAPPDGRPTITDLPSPEDLRGRVLLKAKNLYVTESGGIMERKVTVDTESSSSMSETSASDSEIVQDIKHELKHEMSKARNVDAIKEIREEIQKVRKVEPLKDIKEELSKARNLYDRVRRKKSPSPAPSGRDTLSRSRPATPSRPATSLSIENVQERSKVKMSFELVALLVYTVGVKCRGFNKKETYAPEHVFSLSERTANKVMKQSMIDLIKHNRTHIVRIYPNGMRLSSSNYEPHKYWAAGAQLVAINWQTFDLGYMINHSMFQRNGRAGYVLKPPALRNPNKELLAKRSNHILDLTIISAQQLPRRKNSEGREIIDGTIIDPYIEVSVHVPDWCRSPLTEGTSVSVYPPESSTSAAFRSTGSAPSSSSISGPTAARTTTVRTSVVKNNGFNPVWEEALSLPFDCVGDMLDLIFLRVAVRDERDDASDEPLAVYCVSLGSLQQGYRHLPLHDAQLSQYLFSTLFVQINIRNV